MADRYLEIKKYAKSDQVIQTFADVVGPDNANSYVLSVVTAVSANEQLKQCDPQSIIRSAIRAATLGLSCDPDIGQAYLVPYKGQATFQTGWRGLRDMAYNTGRVAKLNVGVLMEGQRWVEDQMTGDAHIEGIPDKAVPIGYFAYMKTKGGIEHTLYMTVKEIHAHKEKYVPGWKSKYSPWQTSFDKMARKTVLKQMLNQWAEMKPLTHRVESLENSVDSIDNLPAPEDVTITNPNEGKTNEQLMAELGIEQLTEELGIEPYKVATTIMDVEYTEVDEPEPEETPAVEPDPIMDDIGITKPESIVQLKMWAAKGEISYVGVKDAITLLQKNKNDLDKTWNALLKLSKERQAQNNEQDKLF